jgi:phosphatidylglycerophosphate synthase
MFDEYLRRLKDRLFAPVARILGPGVSPDLITWLAFAAGMASAAAVLVDRLGLGLWLWLINRALDGLDGTQARVHARRTSFGAYLDIVLDFAVYAAIPAAMAMAGRSPGVTLAAVWLLAAFYVNAASWTYLAALLEQRDEGAASRGEVTAVTMPTGLVAGTETVIGYALFFLFPSAQAALFSIMAALVAGNVVQRLLWARRSL